MASNQQFELLKDILRCVEQGVGMNSEAHRLAIEWAVSEIERLTASFHEAAALAAFGRDGETSARIDEENRRLRSALQAVLDDDAEHATGYEPISEEVLDLARKALEPQNDKPRHEAGA